MPEKEYRSITVDELMPALERAVALKGEEFVYQGANCRYFRSGEPSCIIGHVIADIRPSWVDDFAEADSSYEDSQVEAPGLRDRFTPEALVAARAAQRLQDCRNPWGEALEQAYMAIATGRP